MAHFAQLDENNVVTQIIVVDNRDITDPHTGQEDEILGIAFCKKLLGGNWKQTSYNNNSRVRYAGIGYSYNAALDAFVPPLTSLKGVGDKAVEEIFNFRPYKNLNELFYDEEGNWKHSKADLFNFECFQLPSSS